MLSRSLQRIADECKTGALEVVHHARAVKHRLLEISRAAKSLTEANQKRMRHSYQKLLALTRGVVRQASEVVQRWGKGRLKVVGKLLRVETQIGQLRHFLPLVEKVITQTKNRVLGGDRHGEDKVLSLFEPHTEVIRKGKAHKPNESVRALRPAKLHENRSTWLVTLTPLISARLNLRHRDFRPSLVGWCGLTRWKTAS